MHFALIRVDQLGMGMVFSSTFCHISGGTQSKKLNYAQKLLEFHNIPSYVRMLYLQLTETL